MLLYCRRCSAMVNADHRSHYDRGDPSDGPTTRVSFMRCPGCWGPFVVEQEDYGGEVLAEPDVLFPVPSHVNRSVPEGIRRAYSEADACFRARAFTAAAVMCRKTLECLCAEHGLGSKPLVQSLKGLRDTGVIESRLYEWADMLRISGNEAVHDAATIVSPEDARDLLEFTNAILEYVFTFRDKFEAFKKRRQGGAGASATST